jgi:arginine repressor
MPRAMKVTTVNLATLSRVMGVLGAIKTKKKAASSAKNLAKARRVLAQKRKLASSSR